MRIAINNPAPTGAYLTQWGDYHFGCALGKALVEAGAEVVQNFWPTWSVPENVDVVLVLRGIRAWIPPPGPANFLWIISNSSTISSDELNRYDLILVASEALRTRLAAITSRPVHLLRQCTDTDLFYPPPASVPEQVRDRDGIIMVANSRMFRRPIVDWAVQGGIQLGLYGTNWDAAGLKHLVASSYVENEDLATLYRGARISLNDHWADMQHDQIISNRIFDAIACGLPVISDWFPELEQVFGRAVHFATNAASLKKAVDHIESNYARVLADVASFSAVIKADYSFARRAREILAFADNRASFKRNPAEKSLSGVTPAHEPLQLALTLPPDKIRMLHVNPSREMSQKLISMGFKYYRSAGFGRGLWHVSLDRKLSVLGKNKYDLIVVETRGMGLFIRLALSARIAHHIHEGSRIVYYPDGPTAMLMSRLTRKMYQRRKAMFEKKRRKGKSARSAPS